MSDNSFYIGWMPKMPASLGKFLSIYVLALFVIVSGVSIVLALGQRPFSKSNFEYGKLTTVEGTYFAKPVPHLLSKNGDRDVMIILVGYGKHGASGVMDMLARKREIDLDGKSLELKGTLIYGDGKTLMQVDGNDQPLVSVSKVSNSTESIKRITEADIKGEIVDPKCFFGVMKPGEGKMHKECAIRCISGGIPPVLKITMANGSHDYIILTKKNADINNYVLNYVATPVTVKGTLTKLHDWFVVDVDSISNID